MNGKFRNLNIDDIARKIGQIGPKFRAQIIIKVLTPEVLEEIKKNREIEKYFKTIKEVWELNKNITEEEAEKDIEEAIIAVRRKK